MHSKGSTVGLALFLSVGIALAWTMGARLRRRRRKTVLERSRGTASRILAYAQEEARRLDHQYIGTEHLLLGLLREPNGKVAEILATAGVSAEKIGDAVGRIIGRGTGPGARPLAVTPRAKRILERAANEAKRRKQEMRPEHLLLALLRDREGMAAEALAVVGLNAKALRKAAMERLRNRK